jgi:CDP-ribitol ribitolphosphotransferase / teichoic acid ribitol-phosphate polymerase
MKYLFYLAKTYSIPIVAPLVEYLAETDRDFAFYASQRVVSSFPSLWDKNKLVYSITEARNFKPDLVLAPGNYMDHRIPGIKVQLFHGLGVEKPVHYKIRHFFDVYLTSGPFVTNKYMKLKQKFKYFDVFETGWLKIDWILNYPAEDLKDKLKMPVRKRIILYAPTFSKTMESASELLSVIPDCIKEDEYWLLKFHEFMPDYQIRSFENIDTSKVRILKREDITPYLIISDLLISDTSSVVYEFLALDKPVITYKTLGNKEKACNITDPYFLRQTINVCLSYPEHLHMQRNKALKEINPYLDGKTSERIVSVLERLNINDYPKLHKPLNLFRKLQVIYHSKFRKGYLK